MSEVLEQARLLGMSMQREARLLAIIAEKDREIERLKNECYKKCGVCEFDYGRAAPPVARSGESEVP